MDSPAKVKISKATLALLSPEERAILGNLIEVKEERKKKSPSVPPYTRFHDQIEEYFLKNFMSCKCCGEKWVEWYFMKEDERGHVLSAELIQDLGVKKFKERIGGVNTCVSCRRNLRKFEKEELISKVIWAYAIKFKFRKKEKKNDKGRSVKSASKSS